MRKNLATLITCSLLALSFSSHSAVFKKKRKLTTCEIKANQCEADGKDKNTCKRYKEACKRDEVGMTCEEIYRKRYGYSYKNDNTEEILGMLVLSVIIPPAAPVFIVMALAKAIFTPSNRTAKLEKMEKKFDNLKHKYSIKSHDSEIPIGSSRLYLSAGFEYGLETGKFCEDYPKIYGKARMRRYIREYLFEHHGIKTNRSLKILSSNRDKLPTGWPEYEKAGAVVPKSNSQ